VWGMLKNPAYKGMAAFGKTRVGDRRRALRPQRGAAEQPRKAYSTYEVAPEDWIYIPVPAIIGEDLYEVVQERLAENRKRSRERARGARHLLQGLLVCAKCGYAYYGRQISKAAAKGKRRGYVYYRCVGTDSYRFGGQRVCSNKQVRSDMLEEAVWQDVCSLLKDPERIEQEWQRRLTAKPDVGWNGTEQLRSTIDKVRRGISRLIDSYQDGLLEKADFEPRIRKAKDRLKQLQADLDQRFSEEEQRSSLRLVIGQMREFAASVADGLDQADWSTRRAIIRAAVKRIEIDEEEVRIVYKISPDSPGKGTKMSSLQHCWRREWTSLGRSFFRRFHNSLNHHSASQGHADDTQDACVLYEPFQPRNKPVVMNSVEELCEVNVHDISLSPTHNLPCRFHRLPLVSSRPEPVAVR